MEISAIIIDDERLARSELKKLLKEMPDVDVLEEAANVEEAIEKINDHNPNVIFLDIQMPGKTGFDLLNSLDFVPKIIFTTAYDDYALKAFEVNAFDYLMKPIEPKRLEAAVQKLRDELSKERNILQQSLHALHLDDQVFVKDGEKCWFVKMNEIRLFESFGNYAKVFFGTNKPLILKSLNALEERLDKRNFFRANRKQIINLQWIDKTEQFFNNTFIVVLRGGEKIEISRRQAQKLKEMMSL